ncbi:hypothetical protein O3P69_013851 [Scylla paramamosain]
MAAIFKESDGTKHYSLCLRHQPRPRERNRLAQKQHPRLLVSQAACLHLQDGTQVLSDASCWPGLYNGRGSFQYQISLSRADETFIFW